MMTQTMCGEHELTRVAERWVTLVSDQPTKRFPGLSERALPLLGLMAAVLDDGKQTSGGEQALEHFVQRLLIPLQLTRFDQLKGGFLGESNDTFLSQRLWGVPKRRASGRLRSLLQGFETLGIGQIEDLARWHRAGGQAADLAVHCHGWSTRQCQWLIWRCLPREIVPADAFRLVAERALGRRLARDWLVSARHQLGLLMSEVEVSETPIGVLDEPGWISSYDRPGLRIIFWNGLIDRLQALFPGRELVGGDTAMLRYAEGGVRWCCSDNGDRTQFYLTQSSWMEGYHLRLSVHGSSEQGQGLTSPALAELARRGWLSGSDTLCAFSCALTTTSVMPPQTTLSSINTHIERVLAEVVAQLAVLRTALCSRTTDN